MLEHGLKSQTQEDFLPCQMILSILSPWCHKNGNLMQATEQTSVCIFAPRDHVVHCGSLALADERQDLEPDKTRNVRSTIRSSLHIVAQTKNAIHVFNAVQTPWQSDLTLLCKTLQYCIFKMFMFFLFVTASHLHLWRVHLTPRMTPGSHMYNLRPLSQESQVSQVATEHVGHVGH